MENREWKEYKIKDVGTVITGKTPSKNNPEDWGDEMPFVTPSDYKHYRKFAKFSDRNLSSIGIERLKSKVLPINSILVTCIGSDMGKIVINKCSVITNQQINSIIPNNNINSDFLYYRLISMYETLRIYGGDGTAVPIVNKGDFENLEIQLPPLPEQKAIASVLSSLDDKIDLLHQQNQTLEALAETLFRQWFIERCPEPVEGEAKEDWEEVKLGDLVNVFNGVSYKSEDLNPSATAMVTLKSFERNGGFRMDGFKEYTGRYKETHVVKEGDLIVAHTDITQDAALIGNPVLVKSHLKYDKLVISMDLVKVVSKNSNFTNEFLYLLMKTREFKEHALGYSNGSTVLHLSKKAIPEFEFKLPPIELVNSFTERVSPLIKKQFVNQKQIQTLTQLRDTLLPKLMSGEVRVKM